MPTVLGLPLNSMSLEQLLASFSEGLLVFHNMDTINKTRHNPEYRRVCREADFAMIDGQALRLIILGLWGEPVEKVSGSDFLPAFCRHHGKRGTAKVFLLGAGPGVAARAMHSFNDASGPVVVGAHSPSFNLLDDDEESCRVSNLITTSGADTLVVGLGAPKQELWIARNRHRLPHVRRFMAVGAALDFEAGRIRRAPTWVSAAGFEWAFRLLMEPQRLWRRYLVEGPGAVTAIVVARFRDVAPSQAPSHTGAVR